MPARTALILVWLLGCLLTAQADPSNVLVGDLTFTRPPTWKWEAITGNRAAQTQFLVPDASGNTAKTSVRFYHTPKDGPTAFEVWKLWFPHEPQELNAQATRIKNRAVTYYQLTGTYVLRGNPPEKDYTLIAAVIPSADKYIHLLLLGPATHVSETLSVFKSMIETAIKEAE
jgi:hypothetical protein